MGCTAAFWLSIAIIFKRGDQSAVETFRRNLATSWHHLTLTLDKDNRDTRDWVLTALPFIFTQAVYRLFCDAFKDDKKSFLSNAQSIVDKLMCVISFEITGFQQNKETLRKERRRLFLPRVLMQPHVNQRDVVKGIKRQELLDDRRGHGGVPSLAFGNIQSKLEQDIDEVQLEHVMVRHNELKEQAAQAAQALSQPEMTDYASQNALNKAEKRAAVPAHLDVDRYNALKDSSEIVDKQLDQFDECHEKYVMNPVVSQFETQQLVKRYSSKELAALDEQSEEQARMDSSPSGTRELSLSKSLMRQSRGVEFDDGELCVTFDSRRVISTCVNAWGDGDQSPGGSSQPSTPTLRRTQSRLSRTNTTTPKTKNRESVAKVQRMRQEQLDKLCRDDPLPDELRSREVNTGWVSPAFARLTPDRVDRKEALQKPATDSYRVKMREPMNEPTRSLSNPLLRPLPKKKKKPATNKKIQLKNISCHHPHNLCKIHYFGQILMCL